MTTLLEYSDKKHRYYADGRERMSVTQVLSAAGLVSTYCMDEEARWRGSEVHAFCAFDDIARGNSLKQVDLRKVDARLRGYIKAWRAYRQDSGFIPELIEHRIDDHTNGYAGRLDRVGHRSILTGGIKQVIVDLKTSKTGSVPTYTKYQLVAYAHALRPNHIYERIAVALKPDGTYSCKVYPEVDFRTDLAQWFQILNSVKGEKNGKRPRLRLWN